MQQLFRNPETYFFITEPSPCPYLQGKKERRLIADTRGCDEAVVQSLLSENGFRRSHDVLYTPFCEDCKACLPVRVRADLFTPSKSQRRVLSVNKSINVKKMSAHATTEQYSLFSKYQSTRHINSDMSNMDFIDYKAMIEETSTNTCIFEFRNSKRLIAVCLVDEMIDGLSAVYSFFDPFYKKYSLGTMMILSLVNECKKNNLMHVYLGYWVQNSPKMSYKQNFSPLEYFNGSSWQDFDLLAT
jgi:Putative arginyl-tRNA:protein arginylyltransferase|tara:strand:+ start:1316 stop:2044 length:729 start_codon:yes stop_codon:yes gene_type:complete